MQCSISDAMLNSDAKPVAQLRICRQRPKIAPRVRNGLRRWEVSPFIAEIGYFEDRKN
jgi:hypothetical protein